MANTENCKVPITEADKKKSYFKYYEKEMTPPDQEKINKILLGPISPSKALAFSERNRLFEPGYLDEEVGYTIMPDGTGYLANCTKMPGVTTEMFDWWFAWHSLDNLRYKIWDPKDHYKAETQNLSRATDMSLSYRERLWNTSHDILEDIGMGPEGLIINFKNPEDMGFDSSKIGTKACSTIVTGNGIGKGQAPFASLGTVMTHFVREIEDGIELRTRFWMGWHCIDGKDVKTLPEGMRVPPMGPMSLLLHNVHEFGNLATLLPKVYAEEKDRFLPE